jgi:hypothetical protein
MDSPAGSNIHRIDLQNQYWPQFLASVNIILQVNTNSYSLLQKSVIV